MRASPRCCSCRGRPSDRLRHVGHSRKGFEQNCADFLRPVEITEFGRECESLFAGLAYSAKLIGLVEHEGAFCQAGVCQRVARRGGFSGMQ